MQKSSEYKNFKNIVNIFYNEEIESINEAEEYVKYSGNIRIEPKIFYDKFSGDMRVEFKIGDKKMYKIKNLAQFYTLMLNKEFYRYGEKLKFIHTKEAFNEESKEMLEFIMKYSEIIKYANSNSNSNFKYYGKALSETSIIIGNTAMDDLFEVLKGKKVEFQKDYNTSEIEFIEQEPNIKFILKKINDEKYVIIPNIEIYKINVIQGKKYKYLLDENKIYRCTKEFESSTLKLLEIFRQNYITELELGKKDLTQLFSIIIPKVKDAIEIEDNLEKEVEEYKPKKLIIKLFLDFDSNDYLICDVKFIYENNEFNPLDEKINTEFPRNMIDETKAMNIFRRTGFMLDTKKLRFILPDNDKIYDFLNNDINYYMQKFEVMVTDNFKKNQIKEPKIGNIGVKIENNLLSINLDELEINIKELEDILEKYSLKMKYYRLKDGSFIDLEKNNEIKFLDKIVTGMDINYKELERGEVRLPVYRTLYLNQLLKEITGTQVLKNEAYKKIVNDLEKEKIEENMGVPTELEFILRYYQKTGFKWLKTLDHYKFGGILADDMGLRKNNTSIICNFRLCSKFKRKKSKYCSMPKFVNT